MCGAELRSHDAAAIFLILSFFAPLNDSENDYPTVGRLPPLKLQR